MNPVRYATFIDVHCSFCQGGDDSALINFAPRIAKDLCPFFLMTSDDTLNLVLDATSVVLQVEDGKWITPELADSLVEVALEVWRKNNKGQLFLFYSVRFKSPE